MTSRPAVPESETPETDTHLSHLNLPDGNKVGIPIETVTLLKSLERRLSLAQTEIKGHMRVQDELRAELKLGPHITGAAPAYTGEGVSMLEVQSAAHVNLRKGRAAIYERAFQLERELALAQARIAELEKDWETDADYVRMAERVKELEKLLGEALENLIWCGGSADFGWGGKAQVGYDKGPRTTIAAIHAALKSRA